MNSLESILSALNEQTITQKIGIPHDEARMNYSLRKNTVESYQDFSNIIAHYYNYHAGRCMVRGGSFTKTEATSRAKEILENEYKRAGGDLNTAYNDAHDGTNGGLRLILDKIAENLKADSVEHYIREVFDRHVEPNSWDHKVELMRQFITMHGRQFESSLHSDQPERYATNYQELIRAFVESLRRISPIFRKF